MTGHHGGRLHDRSQKRNLSHLNLLSLKTIFLTVLIASIIQIRFICGKKVNFINVTTTTKRKKNTVSLAFSLCMKNIRKDGFQYSSFFSTSSSPLFLREDYSYSDSLPPPLDRSVGNFSPFLKSKSNSITLLKSEPRTKSITNKTINIKISEKIKKTKITNLKTTAKDTKAQLKKVKTKTKTKNNRKISSGSNSESENNSKRIIIKVETIAFSALFAFLTFKFPNPLNPLLANANVNTKNYLVDPSQNSQSPVMRNTNELIRQATSFDGINGNSDRSSIPKDVKDLISKRREKLLPIVRIEKTIKKINSSLLEKDYQNLTNLSKILNQPPFTKQSFKKTFNSYSDDILLIKSSNTNNFASTTNAPSTLQSIQYLYRNEALTNIEYLSMEINYLLEEMRKTDSNLDLEDALSYTSKSLEAIENYLKLANQEDVNALRSDNSNGNSAF